MPGQVTPALLIRDRRKQTVLEAAGGWAGLCGMGMQEAPLSSTFSSLTGLSSARRLPACSFPFAVSPHSPSFFISVLSCHLLLVMLAEDPPFSVEVGSMGRKTLYPNEEVMLECVPTVCLLKVFTRHIQNGQATGRRPNSSPSELWVLKLGIIQENWVLLHRLNVMW